MTMTSVVAATNAEFLSVAYSSALPFGPNAQKAIGK